MGSLDFARDDGLFNARYFVNSYTHPLTSKQAEKLRGLLRERGFNCAPKPYTIFFAHEETDVVAIGPARYNELYKKFGNLNSLLGWGHARVIENLLSRRPDCPRSLSDKFADGRVIENALLRHGRKILIEQRPRAESDIAVAAASILAREAFIDWLERKGKELGLKLGRGVSDEIKSTAAAIVDKHGT